MSPPSLPFRWTLPLGGPRGRRTGRDAANGRASGKHSLIEIMPVCIALVVGAITDRSLIRASSPGGGLLRPTAKEWLWVGALLGLTALAVWVTGFYERWLFWRTHEERALTMLSATVVALLLLVESFTAISAILVQEGKVAASGMFYQLSDAAQKRAEEQAALKGGSTSKFLFPSDAESVPGNGTVLFLEAARCGSGSQDPRDPKLGQARGGTYRQARRQPGARLQDSRCTSRASV